MKYEKSKVTVIIPAKNEAEGLAKVIQSVKPLCYQVIVVDGHSIDNTKEICKQEKVTYLLDNAKGKGAAVRMAIKKVQTPYFIVFDADGSPDEKDIPKLVTTLVESHADIVISSRRIGGSFDYSISIDGILRTMGSDFLAYFVNKKFSTNFSDILYCFRVIKKSSFQKLRVHANKFDFEQETIIEALKYRQKIIEIPSRERKRQWGKSKLSTITGVSLLYLLLKELYF